MESTLDLLSLPEEVLQHLGKYLSLTDILSCSETCRYFRSALNNNAVWKRFLPPLEISRLDTQRFQLNLQSSLSPICSFRLLIMKKVHILNNWRKGNFKYNSANTDFFHSSGVFNVPKGRGKLIYEHQYIFTGRFINDIHSDAIEVWNIENEPVLHCALPIEDIEYDSFCIIGKYLVVIIDRTVYVYEINLPEKAFPIKYSFIVSEDSVSFDTHSYQGGKFDRNRVGWSHSIVDQYLISNKSDDPLVLHVWDLLNATKIGTFLSPVENFSIKFHSKMGNYWIFSQILHTNDKRNYFSFDIETQQFSDNYFKLRSYCNHILFHMNLALVFTTADNIREDGWQDTIVSLFDFNSSVKLKERQFNNARQSFQIESTVIVNGSFIILCEGCFQLVDAISLEVLETIECSPMLRFITCRFNVYGCLFVLVSSADYSLELWDINKRSKFPNFLKTVYTSNMYLDDLATKVVCFDNSKIIVAHFW